MSARGSAQVAFLAEVLRDGGTIADARFSMQRDPSRDLEPRYFLTLDQHGVRSLQELPWTPELEEYLLFTLRRPLPRFEEEAERFGTILLNNIQQAEQFGGRDYSQAVLVDLLRQAPYPIQSTLLRIPTPAPSRGSPHHADCEQFLRHSLDGLFNTARTLGYEPRRATELMTAAIEIALDETFHLSALAALA